MWFKYKRKIPKQAKTTQKVVNTHSLVLQHFVRYQLNLRIVVLGLLLPDAELNEDIPKHLVGGDGAGDGAEVVEGFAEVLGDEVTGGAGGDS